MSTLWMFLATFITLALFMLVLALGILLGRHKTRKQECSCKATARVMAAAKRPQAGDPPADASRSPFVILDGHSTGCQCEEDRE
ncbi:MAG: hypothetical protein JW719_09765 [Pirellulales bacterium]|nr:hypothetical protein [Pirellulales bacterium]